MQGCRWWAWLAGHGQHTLQCHPARSRSWAVEVHVFTHAYVSMITYHVPVHVYQSRPIDASLLTTSPQQGCLALKGLHTGWLGAVTGIRSVHIIAAATAERHRGFLVIIITRSTVTVHTSAKVRLTSVAIRIRIRIATIICSLAHCQRSLKISCKSVWKFLCRVANKQTDRQTITKTYTPWQW